MVTYNSGYGSTAMYVSQNATSISYASGSTKALCCHRGCPGCPTGGH